MNLSTILSPREIEILKLVGQAKDTKTIAGELKISPKTVEKHRQTIYDKIGICNLQACTHLAIASGLVPVISFSHLEVPQTPPATA